MVTERSHHDEDRADVEVLRVRLQKMAQLTKKIQLSQGRLEQGGGRLHDAVEPVYDLTARLQSLHRHLAGVRGQVTVLCDPVKVRNEEDAILREGIHRVGLAAFIESVRRVLRALDECATTDIRVGRETILGLRGLLMRGLGQLEAIFRQGVTEGSTPVEPLHFITKQLPFPGPSKSMASSWRKINGVIRESAGQRPRWEVGDRTTTAHCYVQVRSEYLVRTLQNLAAASINTAKRRKPDALYQQGTNGIGTYVTAIRGLFLVEHGIVLAVFDERLDGKIFQATCLPALVEFERVVRELNAHIKANVLTDCFLAYDALGIIAGLMVELYRKTGMMRDHLMDIMQPLRFTAKDSLAEMLADTRRRIMHMPSLPTDGAALPLTSEIVARLRAMATFARPLTAVFVHVGDNGWNVSASASASVSSLEPESEEIRAEGRPLLGQYMIDMIDTLMQNLEDKARALYKSKTVMAVFLANNVAVVDRAARAPDLAPFLAASFARLDGWRKKGVSLYLDGWKDPSSSLLDVQYTNRAGPRPPSGSSPSAVNSLEIVRNLGNREKEAIKDKFRTFNAAFDDMITRHRALTMEAEIRALLARELQALIEPLYSRFWDRYHEIDKGKGKYVRYDKAQLAAVLASLA
ncbi:MAG: exocyst complex component exo70 [Phylliscum demangeonii]|nr:MAG: exocyst complex component exo70 [Phylliscum demangeonii]